MEDKRATGRFAFDFSCTEQEYHEAVKTVAFRVGTLRVWPLVALISAALLLGTVQAVVLGDLSFQQPLAAVLLLGGVLLPVIFTLFSQLTVREQTGRCWRLYQQMGACRHCTSYSGGLILSGDNFQNQLPFVDCRMLVEKKDFWLIIKNRDRFVVIPKRDIPEADQMAFAEFLRHAFIRGRAFGR